MTGPPTWRAAQARLDPLRERLAELVGALRASGDGLGGFGEGMARTGARARAAAASARRWLDAPGNLRRAGTVLLAVLLVAGLLLPPVSLVTRLTTLGYAKLEPGRDVSVRVDDAGTYVEVSRRALTRSARVQVKPLGGLPRGTDALPAGRQFLGRAFSLDLRGPAPREMWLSTLVDITAEEQALVDPYGWDGEAWRWLPLAFDGPTRARVRLALDAFVPEYVVLTRAVEGASDVSAVLLPPPAAVPAAVTELPILEIRAYTLRSDDGHVVGQRFAVPTRRARLYGVVDNLEGQRLRGDLVNNILIQSEARQRHRDTLVNLARRDGLAGIVLDYRSVAGDLVPVYADWLGRLRDDLHAVGAELFITTPMPRQVEEGWDDSPYTLRALAPNVDGVRVLLPNDAPLDIAVLDAMIRWALQSVPRDKLQLAVPVQGRDIVDGVAGPISYGDALARVLDMARSDAPGRISPGAPASVELPTIRAAELGRDAATGMWRFYYWDANRRQHTVWLNDADGLRPAFEISRRYFLSRLVLDGVEAGLDPSLWRMTQAFIASGAATAPDVGYRLQWQLVDDAGQVVQEAVQPLETPAFAFRAPDARGRYSLGVNLVTSDDRLAAVGSSLDVDVAPPPPPSPTATPNVIYVQPTPIPYVTAAAPADEALRRREPVRIQPVPAAVETAAPDAEVVFAEAQLRSEPSTSGASEVLSDLRVGDRLAVVGRTADGTWLRVIIISTGVEGWVLAQLVELAIDPARVPILGAGSVGTPVGTPNAPRSRATPTTQVPSRTSSPGISPGGAAP